MSNAYEQQAAELYCTLFFPESLFFFDDDHTDLYCHKEHT